MRAPLGFATALAATSLLTVTVIGQRPGRTEGAGPGVPTFENVAVAAGLAFTHTNGVGDNSVTWNPTVSVRLPLSAVAGNYSGTLTFSVA